MSKANGKLSIQDSSILSDNEIQSFHEGQSREHHLLTNYDPSHLTETGYILSLGNKVQLQRNDQLVEQKLFSECVRINLEPDCCLVGQCSEDLTLPSQIYAELRAYDGQELGLKCFPLKIYSRFKGKIIYKLSNSSKQIIEIRPTDQLIELEFKKMPSSPNVRGPEITRPSVSLDMYYTSPVRFLDSKD